MSSIALWTTEHTENLRLQGSIDTLSKPNFEVEPISVILEGTDEHITVFTTMTVFNHGAPSVVRNWSLTITFPEGRKLEGIPVLQAHTEITPPGVADGQGWTFDSNQSLIRTATVTPIQTGAQASGFIAFRLPGVKISDLKKDGLVMSLTLKDINGKAYTFVHPLRDDMTIDHNQLSVPPNMMPVSK